MLTPAAFRNAQVVLQAIGGSTNGLIHLTAIANRTAHRIDLEAFDKLGREVPVLIDLKPSGAHYMEHFHHAGGVPKLMAQLGDLIDLDARTIAGKTLRDVVAGAEEVPGQDAIRPRTDPIKPEGAMAVLHGNLAPRGAVIKHSAASPKLLQHTGRAVVFDSVEDMTLAGRRSRARRHRRRRAGAAQCRPQGRAGHAGGRLSADPDEARRAPASRTWCGFRMHG